VVPSWTEVGSEFSFLTTW